MIDQTVSGKSKVLGIIGNPVSHSFSPYIHNTIASRMGHSYRYLPFLVAERDVEAAVKGAYALGIRGLNVTMPHKMAVMPFLASIDKLAQAAGAVNTIKYTEKGYEGYNTDITGIMRAFQYADMHMNNQSAVILGAGGTACAAAVALCEMGIRRITILNRTRETAEKLAAHIRQAYDVNMDCLGYEDWEEALPAGAVIQTTTVGFEAQAGLSPIADISFLRHIPFALDVIYSPWETAFLKQAKEAGAVTRNGFDVLIYQAVRSYEIWTESQLSPDFVAELREETESFFLGLNG